MKNKDQKTEKLFSINRVITRVTENSISTIKFYRVFLKIYER